MGILCETLRGPGSASSLPTSVHPNCKTPEQAASNTAPVGRVRLMLQARLGEDSTPHWSGVSNGPGPDRARSLGGAAPRRGRRGVERHGVSITMTEVRRRLLCALAVMHRPRWTAEKRNRRGFERPLGKVERHGLARVIPDLLGFARGGLNFNLGVWRCEVGPIGVQVASLWWRFDPH